MNHLTIPYPPPPPTVPAAVTAPSARFKKEVIRVLGAIILFFLVYILMMILSLALAAGCVYAGIILIINLHNLYIVFFGLGIIGLGLMVLFFLVKFIFAISKFDHSGSLEVNEAEQPALFAFIRRLADETNTPLPRKIFLSPEVNACVFYDSSFWSMLLPVKKNLQIGLGLVNTVDLGEFKAIMAHEFGHFSQQSMKLGSFVYNVNKVIYNMLYDNKGYISYLQRWARIHASFALFARLTVRIVNAIQWVLQQMYRVVNKSYKGLSREMEFHADAVAAGVSGSNNCISALRRVELADRCYQLVLQKWNEWLKEKYKSRNLYKDQHAVLAHYAQENKLALQEGLPVVTGECIGANDAGRVNFKDQWASHPALKERERQLQDLDIHAEGNHRSAWVLFEQPETLQEQMTAKVYDPVPDRASLSFLEEFGAKYDRERNFYSLPAVYRGFYDDRPLSELDVEELADRTNAGSFTKGDFSTLFSAVNAGLPKKISAGENDLAILKAIVERKLDTRSFDFDGQKYSREQAAVIMEKISGELEKDRQEVEALDRQAFRFFYCCALKKDQSEANTIKSRYRDYFKGKKEAGSFFANCHELMELLRPVFSGQSLTLDKVNELVGQLKEEKEDKLKRHLQQLSAQGVWRAYPDFKAAAEKFIDSQYAYFSGNSFFDNELNELYRIVNEGCRIVTEYWFVQYKMLLELQLAPWQ